MDFASLEGNDSILDICCEVGSWQCLIRSPKGSDLCWLYITLASLCMPIRKAMKHSLGSLNLIMNLIIIVPILIDLYTHTVSPLLISFSVSRFNLHRSGNGNETSAGHCRCSWFFLFIYLQVTWNFQFSCNAFGNNVAHEVLRPRYVPAPLCSLGDVSGELMSLECRA